MLNRKFESIWAPKGVYRFCGASLCLSCPLYYIDDDQKCNATDLSYIKYINRRAMKI